VGNVHSGRRGRPRKTISPELLQQAFHPGHSTTIASLARNLKMDRKTLTRIISEQGYNVHYSDITSDALDSLVRDFFAARPDSGYQYCHAHIRTKGYKVRRTHVKASMARVRPLAALVRQGQAIVRRSYQVTRPNEVWHQDGYHKLIKYGQVIHGFIDGYCRTVHSFFHNKPIILT
jgi:UDP-N-acetylglucosamine enolpyruvyl transferase